MNYIIETVSKSIEENWCDSIGCTTCGGQDLMNFMYRKAKENLERDGEIQTSLENINYFLDYRRMEENVKSKFIFHICEKLNDIDDVFSDTAPNFYREANVLRRIIYEVYILLNGNNDELRNLLKEQGLASRLFEDMEQHHERDVARWKRKEEYYSPEAVKIRREEKRVRIEQEHTKRVNKSKLETSAKLSLMQAYFRKKNKNLFQDIIEKKLDFPVNLLPVSELDELKKEIKNLDIISTSILIKNFPKKSPDHIKVFRKRLVEHKSDIISKKNLKVHKIIYSLFIRVLPRISK